MRASSKSRVALFLPAAIFGGACGAAATPDQAGGAKALCALARQSGMPQIPGLTIVYFSPLGDPAAANRWENIVIHQMEGPAGCEERCIGAG